MDVSPNTTATASTDDTGCKSARSCLCPLVTLPWLCLDLCSMLSDWCGIGHCYSWWKWGREGRVLLGSCLDGTVCARVCVRAAVVHVACGVVVLWLGLAANIEGSEWTCLRTRLLLPPRTTQDVSQHAVACALWPPSHVCGWACAACSLFVVGVGIVIHG